MVKSIIHERTGMNHAANMDVRSKWALDQVVTSPILSVPISISEIIDEKEHVYKSYYHFLPEDLHIQASVSPKTLSRGIFEVIVYEAKLNIKGNFKDIVTKDLSHIKDVLWEEAFITVGFSDLRGIQNDHPLIWNEDEIASVPGTKITHLSAGLTFPLEDFNPDLQESHSFNMVVELQGSENLSFVPTGKVTTASIQSGWTSPSFSGAFLPDERHVTNTGFKAQWQVLQVNRNFPQNWEGHHTTAQLHRSAFGVNFILPSDSYQKSIRAIKYALMNIAMTFLIFFLVEVITKSPIHPFQYIMVGLSIILFYVLLVSLSEHLSFDRSYLIAGTAVVSMIYLYSLSIFKSLKFSIYLLALSILNFVFLYIILQMTDYALLIGGISMTGILAAVMYGTRKIDWYNIQK